MYDEQFELLNEALNELDLLLAKSEQKALVYSFIDSNERFIDYVKSFYERHHSEKEVPPDEEVPTVLYELVIAEKMTQDQIADLFDQFIAAALLSTPGWFESQPAENFEDIIQKIPQFHRAMCSAVRIMNRIDEEGEYDAS